MRGGAWFAIMAISMLSGCGSPQGSVGGGDGEGEDVGTTTEVTIPPTAGNPDDPPQYVTVQADKGVVLGRVVADVGPPVAGARASLVGTDFFADTDADGGFLFANVSAGAHRLSVQAAGYTSDLRDIEVRKGNLTEVEVVLVPDPVGGSVHVHDQWRGGTEVVLMDDDFELTVDENRGASYPGYDSAYYGVYQPNANATTFPLILPERDDNRAPIVFPGTARMEITVTWDDDAVILDHIGLRYNARYPAVNLPPVPEGGTWVIPVNASMWDGGHAPWTSWRFAFFYGNSAQGSPTTWDPSVVLGPIHVKVVIFKGAEPPLDPPHEDFWANGGTLPLNVTKTPLTWGGPDTTRSRPEEQFTLARGSIVPPGATHLLLEFQYTLQSPVDEASGKSFHLRWRGADKHWYHTPLGEFETAPASPGPGGAQIYNVTLRGDQADGFYQTVSEWAWVAAEDGAEGERAVYHVGGIEFTLKVTAVRVA